MQSHQSVFFAKSNLLFVACCLLVGLSILATPALAQKYPGVKCVVDGNLQCNIQHAVEYGQGKVFFSSQAAAKRFQVGVVNKLKAGQKPQRSLLLKANHQLALTDQVKQQRCPVTGKPIEKEHRLLIAGVSVFFHDLAAKEKIQSAESTWHRAQQVFASGVFTNSFAAPVKLADQSKVAVADESAKPPVVKSGNAVQPTTR